jgi:hypothetical protein
MVNINILYNNVSKQGLGNRLFQYCWARQIAEKKNYALFSSPISGFPCTYNNVEGIQKFNNPYTTPEITQIFDMDNIYGHDGQIIISGYSQRYEHYVNNKENIKKWLFIENEESFEKPDPLDIVLNIRLGDYVGLGWDIDMNYYIEILKKETFNKAIIICDEPNNHRLDILKQMGCIIKDNTNYGISKYLADFVYVKNSNKTIISNSTFSWWATFLGNGKVYFPCFKFPWLTPETTFKSKNIEEIDLRVFDEDRYVFVY